MIVRPDEDRAMEFGNRDKGSSKADIVELKICVKTKVRAMIVAVLIITQVSFAARSALYMWGEVEFLQPLRLFDVGEERSIPTWFESILFLLEPFELGGADPVATTDKQSLARGAK